MEYQELTEEQQAQLVKGRILQYEADHFAIALDKQIAEARAVSIELSEEEKAAAAAQIMICEKNMTSLEKALETTRTLMKPVLVLEKVPEDIP